MSERPRNPQLRLLPLPADYEPPYDLDQAIPELATAEELIHWLRELIRDYWEGDEDWANDTLDLFLEGLAGAVGDQLKPDAKALEINKLAELLLAATVRE